ncbi:LuxR C-terminal-related transcriptional regulator [Nocardioides sp. zg-DK7169]|uniref:helix-turn-helix transcriptional regulator n=1 Tax=Nocardioides sp. zg-DK7169 TaxID=2736600 RepID=UPI001556B1DF|nr:LuxR C-terminal-related transcriptional regulator [Nocardioides sp. zg-DK7169]NPC97951.1 response regulator transcription factor [Nocardioides sp. zg-DK7169]
MDRPVRLLVASELPLVAEAIRAALRGRGFVAMVLHVRLGGVFAAQERAVRRFAPDLLLVASELVRPLRLHDVRELVHELALPCVVLTEREPGPVWGAMLDSGADEVIPTSAALDEVETILRRVLAGEGLMAQATREQLLRAWRITERESAELNRRIAALTPRELETIQLLHAGRTVLEIADLCRVADGTVRSHVRSILRKLAVNSQLAAVATYTRFLSLDRSS